MSEAAIVVVSLVVTTVLIRASGPVTLGGRELPARYLDLIALLAPALLAALVTTQTFGGTGSELVLDERALGVAGAAGVVALRGSVLWAMAVAVVLTAGARALT